MGTKSIKDDYIKIRVTSKEKKKLKIIAESKNMTMSEILLVATKKEIEIYEEKEKNHKKIYDRAVATEKKIQEIKINLEKRKVNNKKGFLNKFIKNK
ncbi:CopG family transcriptional regulator [Clostridium botulinum]|uniref:CopG family transcriptional regulator n=1 Tax=Clostridium botulinum TaxID=1491 RepID=A0A9Q4TKP9_CLOBO|nr:CopG family transcriptional regulator [Clostridium botulinum]NFQ62250.1 CopG family transcriptional regulator [Clostridium sporogenes]MBY6935751.1 CopG family transcriptional regulator [Clostridium botulinum]NFL84843.1 CopG family transcriptional regulator [Clostridium botulinum]NFN13310.1 CopG family transcriptional regulator [Clostridium botulinum]NFO38479.1 CopG family transcriptional regulator [Clostridium botulinum]